MRGIKSGRRGSYFRSCSCCLWGARLRSRAASSARAKGFDFGLMVRNLSRMLLRIVAYVVLLVVLQYCIGLRPSLGW